MRGRQRADAGFGTVLFLKLPAARVSDAGVADQHGGQNVGVSVVKWLTYGWLP